MSGIGAFTLADFCNIDYKKIFLSFKIYSIISLDIIINNLKSIFVRLNIFFSMYKIYIDLNKKKIKMN